MQKRPLLILAALAAATEPDFGKGAIDDFKKNLREGFVTDPLGATAKTVLVGSWLFYQAEKGHNPKVTSYYDALVYVSTCLSVGYSDIFAKTETGKLIGTALMTLGPAMATRALDEPVVRSGPSAATAAGPAGPMPAAPPGAAGADGANDARAVTGGTAPLDERSADLGAIVDRLDRILAALEARDPRPTPTPSSPT